MPSSVVTLAKISGLTSAHKFGIRAGHGSYAVRQVMDAGGPSEFRAPARCSNREIRAGTDELHHASGQRTRLHRTVLPTVHANVSALPFPEDHHWKDAWRSCRYCGRPAAPAGAPALPAPRWIHATAARERSAPRDSSSNPDTAQDHHISQPTHHTRHAEDQSTYLNAYVQPCATIITSDSHQQ